MQLSLDYLAKSGWTCWIVEKRLPIPGKHVTQDCFNFADILAYTPGGIALIQTTSWSNFNARAAKIRSNPHVPGWLKAGGQICLQGWGPKGLREAWM